jgi:hypothetical protein
MARSIDMNSKESFTGQYVRVRPTSGLPIAIGQVLAPSPFPRVHWFYRSPKSVLTEIEELDCYDLIPLPMDEGRFLQELIPTLHVREKSRAYRVGFEVAVELWLDLRRDGINVQQAELIADIKEATKHIRAQSIKEYRRHGSTH